MALVVIASSAPARAQSGDEASALSLFEDAKKLSAEGKYAEACPKFASSYKLAQKLGTLMNLADCYENTGQTASAWARFTEAATLAERAGQPERMEYAKQHAAALAPKLSRLTIRVAVATAGLAVTRDGAPVDAAMLGEAVAVDPGTHVIEAKAPGKKPWSTKVDVAPNAAQANVEVPKLLDLPGEPAPTSAPETQGRPVTIAQQDTTGSAQRVWGVVITSAGILGIIGGSVLAVAAADQYNATKTSGDCIGNVCNANGTWERNNAFGTARPATYVLVGAAVLLAGGITLYATAPSPNRPSTARVAAMKASPSGLWLEGSF